MTANYVLLEKITVGAAGAASVTFSGIPQTGYTDLVVKASARSATTTDYYRIILNGSTANFTNKYLVGNGTVAVSGSEVLAPYGRMAASTFTANTFASDDWYIPNYAGSTYKSISVDAVTENNATQSYQDMVAGLWSQTAAITSVGFIPNSGSFAANSTFYLYGVAKLGTTPAIVPYATGGDTIMTDGTFWYHTFISSGTFTPAKAISCDYLVIAGGGGGGSNAGGGGGAGGLRSTVTATGGGGTLESPVSLNVSAYTITVGAGGVGSATNGSQSSVNGTNSSVSGSGITTITSVGGGKSGNSTAGSSGGSGGGSGVSGAGAASGTANQGFAGGTTNAGNVTGGGGGAGQVGFNNASGSVSGAGGNGVATSILGSSVTYAGGGGGGSEGGTRGLGGSGGGGNGGQSNQNGSNGVVNTGGGGGGGSNGAVVLGGTGGSGIVIIRYAV